MLGTRVLSSLVILPPVLGVIWWGGAPYVILVTLCGGLMAWELYRLARVPSPVAAAAMAACCGAVAPIAVLGGTDYALYGGLGGLALAWALLRRAPIGTPERGAILGFNILILLTSASLVRLRFEPEVGRALVFWLVATIAATDIGAYFAGRAIGGPKLAPRISPHKTWAGLIGGVVLAGVTGLIAAQLTARPMLPMAIAGALVAPVAQLGDLSESWIKRRMGVKDSGTLIPGHGGLLDRLDGYLTVAPLVALIALSHRGVF